MTLKDYINLIIEMLEANNKPLNGRLVLYSDELEVITGVSINNQSNQRNLNTFPFAYEKIGKRITVSIVSVAKWLMSKETEHVKQQLKPIFNQPMPVGAKSLSTDRAKKKRIKAQLSKDWFLNFKANIQERLNILSERDYLDDVLNEDVKPSNSKIF